VNGDEDICFEKGEKSAETFLREDNVAKTANRKGSSFKIELLLFGLQWRSISRLRREESRDL
jgi:hypothetical protein